MGLCQTQTLSQAAEPLTVRSVGRWGKVPNGSCVRAMALHLVGVVVA